MAAVDGSISFCSSASILCSAFHLREPLFCRWRLKGSVLLQMKSSGFKLGGSDLTLATFATGIRIFILVPSFRFKGIHSYLFLRNSLLVPSIRLRRIIISRTKPGTKGTQAEQQRKVPVAFGANIRTHGAFQTCPCCTTVDRGTIGTVV